MSPEVSGSCCNVPIHAPAPRSHRGCPIHRALPEPSSPANPTASPTPVRYDTPASPPTHARESAWLGEHESDASLPVRQTGPTPPSCSSETPIPPRPSPYTGHEPSLCPLVHTTGRSSTHNSHPATRSQTRPLRPEKPPGLCRLPRSLPTSRPSACVHTPSRGAEPPPPSPGDARPSTHSVRQHGGEDWIASGIASDEPPRLGQDCDLPAGRHGEGCSAFPHQPAPRPTADRTDSSGGPPAKGACRSGIGSRP